MSNQSTIFEEVRLQPSDNGIGKKCYATAKITHEVGAFPNKRYFTTNRLRYVGLYTRNEQINDSYRWYFQNPFTQEETFFEMKNPLAQWKSPDSIPEQKNGFVEVVCHGSTIPSLQHLSRYNFKKYLNSLPNYHKEEFNDALKENEPVYEIISPPLLTHVKGGKMHKKTRKGYKRKLRKRSKKSRRRR